MYKFENQSVDVDLYGTIYKVRLIKLKYYEGKTAIEGIMASDSDNEEPFSTLSVHIPMTVLEDDEICIKNWSENEQFAKACLASGFFLNTGKTVKTGFVEAPIWLMLKEGK
jgi:hypothetical protein